MFYNMPLKPLKTKPRLDKMKHNAAQAYNYAMWVMKGRWPAAEPNIMKDSWAAYSYARDVIGDRWPEAEPVIMKNSAAAAYYAANILKRRWPEAEPYIKKIDHPWYFYKNYFKID